jgi:peroxiredoxin
LKKDNTLARKWLTTGSIAVLLTLLVGCASLQPPPEATQPLAVVNGVAITPAMIERELKISRLNVLSPLPPLQGDELAMAQEEALNQLITRQLILQAARRQGFALTNDEIRDRVELLYGTFSAEELAAALQQAGATEADLLWWVGEIFTVEEFTTDVLLAETPPEQRQEAYNAWFNALRAEADIRRFSGNETPLALAGEPAPHFTLQTPAGETVSLADYAGQVVLVNFWATWCPSCVTEMPDYEQVYRQKQPDFVVLAVNFQESQAQVQRYAAGLGLSFPVLLDSDGRVTSHTYQLAGMPGSFLIDRDGVIVYRHVGPMSRETLLKKLADLGL